MVKMAIVKPIYGAYGAVTGIAGKSDVTTANADTALNETLVNSFDKDRVNAQTECSGCQ